jgi:hypothetical protein
MKPVPRIREDDAYDDNGGLHPVWLANNFLRRRKYDECVAICSDILAKNPYDQVRLFELPDPKCRLACNPSSAPLTSPPPLKAVWYLKCRALTLKNWIDDAEIEEEVRRGVHREEEGHVGRQMVPTGRRFFFFSFFRVERATPSFLFR